MTTTRRPRKGLVFLNERNRHKQAARQAGKHNPNQFTTTGRLSNFIQKYLRRVAVVFYSPLSSLIAPHLVTRSIQAGKIVFSSSVRHSSVHTHTIEREFATRFEQSALRFSLAAVGIFHSPACFASLQRNPKIKVVLVQSTGRRRRRRCRGIPFAATNSGSVRSASQLQFDGRRVSLSGSSKQSREIVLVVFFV